MKRFGRFLIVVLILLVVIIAVAAVLIYRQLDKETIKLGGTEGELVFMSDRDGNWDYFMLDKDGNLHNLTDESDAHEYFPNFTFTGDQLSGYSTDSGSMSPMRVNSDGSGFKVQSVMEAMMAVLQEGNTDWDPVWAPGGERMAWTKLIPAVPLPKLDLLVANADGSDERNLTDDSATEFMYNWSPDGTKVVYISDKSGKQNIYVVDVTSGEITRLTEHDVQEFQPVWSSDGSQILFVSEDTPLVEGTMQLFVMNADGSDQRPFGEDETFKGDMAYSPYGGQVVYMSNEDGNWHIYVMNADGSDVQRLTEGDSNNMFPSWRPVPASEQAEAAGE
jgi:TolB protein